MASRTYHLMPVLGQEIVFCHSCNHEWYRDAHDHSQDCPVCPSCHSDFTEIVTYEHDPRLDASLASLTGSDAELRSHLARHQRGYQLNHPEFHHHHHHHNADSDPEEADIEEDLFHVPGRVSGNRTVHRSPEPVPYGPARPNQSDSDVLRRFSELIGASGAPSTLRTSVPETFVREELDGGGSRITYQAFNGPGFTGGLSSFTITTGPPARVPPSSPGPGPGLGSGSSPAPGPTPGPAPGHRDEAEPFMRIFSEILRAPHTIRQPDPPPRDPIFNNYGAPGPERPANDITTILNQLFAVIVNPNMAHGDAVYSQEALDRIITNLMESNPSSNAPPPASENAIASLPKRKLNESMLGPELKGECTICIEDVHVGDEVAVLPCGHWFHEECAGLWLKQHNSCPVCRAAIDSVAAGKTTGSHAASATAAASAPASSSRSTPYAERGQGRQSRREEGGFDFIRGLSTAYDGPPVRRRDSNSPPADGSSSQYTRRRQRSPSSRDSSNGERGRDNRGPSNSGPLGWIRERFTGR